MAGSLSTYWKKRDFRATAEPRGEVARTGERLSFVIQKHAASRLHYDFRLELEGVLKSWAVPKGPSLDPRIRRMAVQTEDHPMGYASFEGVIPAGQYGAGTVIVWDRGQWNPVGDPVAGYRKGRLKFDLKGEKLKGRWNLVRIEARRDERQAPWLLIKEDDPEARPAGEYDVTEAAPDSVLKRKAKGEKRKAGGKARGRAARAPHPLPSQARPADLPVAFFPQLATLVDAPPTGDDWIYEVKLDGYRLLARIDGGDVRLFTRNGNDWTRRLGPLRDAVRALGLGSGWLDGEIVVLDDDGLPDFQALQNAFDASRTADIAYFVFDLPHFGGHDLTRVPLVERRALLEAALARHPSPAVRFSASFEGDGATLLEGACRQGLEGLIAKRAQAPYASSRSTSWIKLKCRKRQEFVVAGYTDPKGSRVGFGSLLLGVHDAAGRLAYAGSVGTGFDDASLRGLLRKLRALETDQVPFHERPKGVKGHWVKPKLVAEVAFGEWTADGRIRHPVFHGLRTDKAPQAVTREAAAAPAIQVTHPERVVDRSTGTTKLDLVNYYADIAPRMIPHLAGRPIALVRAPGGIGGELFFQKHGDKTRIAGIRQLPRDCWPGHPAMLEIASPEALVSAAQMNVVEFHTWNSTTADIAHPDRVIFDLDPGEGVDWGTLKEGTALVRKMLGLLGLEGFLKTSGGKGLHVVVPLEPAWDYGRVKAFSEAVVVHMARTIPALFVAKSGARNRVGRIFIDYLRNGRGATTVAAFSARARPGLGVSVPLAWRELAGLERADQWNIVTVRQRLARQRTDPWKDYAATRQRLDPAWEKLGRVAVSTPAGRGGTRSARRRGR